MKVLSLLLLLLQTFTYAPNPPAVHDQNNYLLIYQAQFYHFQGGMILTGQSSNVQYPTSDAVFRTSDWPSNQPTIEYRNEVFTDLAEVKKFIDLHTVHYNKDGTWQQPWDFQLMEIEGLYKLSPVNIEKIQTGTHTEDVQTTKTVEKPNFEWRIQ